MHKVEIEDDIHLDSLRPRPIVPSVLQLLLPQVVDHDVDGDVDGGDDDEEEQPDVNELVTSGC